MGTCSCKLWCSAMPPSPCHTCGTDVEQKSWADPGFAPEPGGRHPGVRSVDLGHPPGNGVVSRTRKRKCRAPELGALLDSMIVETSNASEASSLIADVCSTFDVKPRRAGLGRRRGLQPPKVERIICCAGVDTTGSYPVELTRVT